MRESNKSVDHYVSPAAAAGETRVALVVRWRKRTSHTSAIVSAIVLVTVAACQPAGPTLPEDEPERSQVVVEEDEGARVASHELASTELTIQSSAVVRECVVKPDCVDMDFVLSEKLNWLSTDVAVEMMLTVDPAGNVVSARTVSIEPNSLDVAEQLAEHLTRCARSAKFEEAIRQTEVQLTVRFDAARDEYGRLK